MDAFITEYGNILFWILMAYIPIQIGGLIWLDAKHGSKPGAREERGHGIVHSDMDRG